MHSFIHSTCAYTPIHILNIRNNAHSYTHTLSNSSKQSLTYIVYTPYRLIISIIDAGIHTANTYAHKNVHRNKKNYIRVHRKQYDIGLQTDERIYIYLRNRALIKYVHIKKTHLFKHGYLHAYTFTQTNTRTRTHTNKHKHTHTHTQIYTVLSHMYTCVTRGSRNSNLYICLPNAELHFFTQTLDCLSREIIKTLR